MEDSRGQVSGVAARLYETFFVPALFAEWPPRIADLVAPRPGQRALDVACGTGVLARELARRTDGPSVVGLDRNDGMLAVARAESRDIEWVHGRAEALPWPADHFDVVASQFGLMFFDDRVGALREMWRVLRPGGAVAVAVWGSLDATPGYAAVVALLERLFGPAIANELRVPYCLGEVEALRALARDADFRDFEIITRPGTARFPSLTEWVRIDIKGWTLADEIDEAQLERLQAEAASALARFVGPDGTVSFDAPAHIVHARKPLAS